VRRLETKDQDSSNTELSLCFVRQLSLSFGGNRGFAVCGHAHSLCRLEIDT
jgi:hypothetical protein